MKKQEAIEVAKLRVNLILEYILQILGDEEKINGKINFSSAKINGEKMTTLDIYVPYRNFEKHLNLGIPIQHVNALYELFLNEVVNSILNSETIGATRYSTLKGMGLNFEGIECFNANGSKIKINMPGISREIGLNYNLAYSNFENSIKAEETKKR